MVKGGRCDFLGKHVFVSVLRWERGFEVGAVVWWSWEGVVVENAIFLEELMKFGYFFVFLGDCLGLGFDGLFEFENLFFFVLE